MGETSAAAVRVPTSSGATGRSAQLPIAVIQMGVPPADVVAWQGEPADWFAAALGLKTADLLIVRPDLGAALPAARAFSLAIITGSWAMVTDHEDWSERTGAWARSLILAGKPLLGVCYGHQLMASAMGGRVDYHPAGREQGTFPVTLSSAARSDRLFASWPGTFDAQLSHSQSVMEPPPGMRSLGGTRQDPNQILRYGPNALSLQFHPEFSVDILATIMGEHHEPAQHARAQLRPTPDSQRILRQFVANHQAGAWAAAQSA